MLNLKVNRKYFVKEATTKRSQVSKKGSWTQSLNKTKVEPYIPNWVQQFTNN